MNALVLSGGSIKGSFQAGAIATILKHGYEPDYIWGVSVGALNGAFLAERAGRAQMNGEPVNWPAIGEELKQFWLANITRASDIVRRRSEAKLVWEALLGKYNGLLNTTRLHRLIRETILYDHLLQSPVSFFAGVVDLESGLFHNVDARNPNLIEYILASTAIPILMPVRFINGRPIADGGVRDVAPLRHAFHAGARRIVAVACHPPNYRGGSLNAKNLVRLIDRVTAIQSDEVLQNDLDYAVSINKLLPLDGSPAIEGPHAGKRRVPMKVIRPAEGVEIDLLEFDADDIAAAIRLGEVTADMELRNFDVSTPAPAPGPVV